MLPTAPPAPSLPGHPAETNSGLTCAYEIVGIGASLGGLAALTALLSPLSGDFPLPVLMVQHLSANSYHFLPKLLAGRTRLRVKWAEMGEKPQPGTVYIAPPDHHLLVAPDGTLALSQSERVNYCRPAIDVLFRSLAEVYGGRAIGIVLTGMGRDGARGMRAIRAGNGLGMAQDEASAVAPSMPWAAVELGMADIVLPPHRIALALQAAVQPVEMVSGSKSDLDPSSDRSPAREGRG